MKFSDKSKFSILLFFTFIGYFKKTRRLFRLTLSPFSNIRKCLQKVEQHAKNKYTNRHG
jgi:hypothetical protein